MADSGTRALSVVPSDLVSEDGPGVEGLLELGHCLRLPQEGPCECDLYLTCPKFLTTTKYAPRLRERLCVEQQLAADAQDRGWAREVERHERTAERIRTLLGELGELGEPSTEQTEQ